MILYFIISTLFGLMGMLTLCHPCVNRNSTPLEAVFWFGVTFMFWPLILLFLIVASKSDKKPKTTESKVQEDK